MSSVEIDFLSNIKLIFEHGTLCARNNSKLMRLLALHEIHYVIEQVLREKASAVNFHSHTKLLGFRDILLKLHKKQNIPDKDHLLDLNEDRNRAEHRNKIPSKEEIQFYVRIAEGFLRWSYKAYFKQDFDSIFLEERIIDKPIRCVMKLSRDHIKKGELKEASQRMYEGLGAFKFMMFRYLSDYRISKQMLEGKGLDVDLADIMTNISFKLLFGDDFNTLKKLSEIKTNFAMVKGRGSFVRSNYPTPEFKDREEAEGDYEEVLNIILTYQDKIPSESWRHEDSYDDLKQIEN